MPKETKHSKKHGLISSYNERLQRGFDVRMTLLEFLKDEIYTTIDIVCELCGYSTKRGAEMMLKKIENEGYIKSIRRNLYSAHGQKVYGITTSGVSFCTPENEMPDKPKVFLPYKLNLSQFEHKVKIQKIRIGLSNIGREIGDINDFPFKAKLPDLITVDMKLSNENSDSTEYVNCYEMELTIKSIPRYRKIIMDYETTDYRFKGSEKDYKTNFRKLLLKNVIWITESEDSAKKLKSIFNNLIRSFNSNIRIDVNHQFVSFDTISEWIKLTQNT